MKGILGLALASVVAAAPAQTKAPQAAGASEARDAAARGTGVADPLPPNLMQRRAAYLNALRSAIVNQWNRPASVALGERCNVSIVQIPSGEVIDVEIMPGCRYDEAGKRSIVAAVLKAQPLPYYGFESVFTRKVVLSFIASD